MKNTAFMKIIRWTARIIGTLLVVFSLIFFIVSLIEDSQNQGLGLEAYNIIVFAVLGIGFAALILAWWKEGLGGIIALISFIVFNILAAVSPVEGSRYMISLLFPLLPSILYLLYHLLKRKILLQEKFS